MTTYTYIPGLSDGLMQAINNCNGERACIEPLLQLIPNPHVRNYLLENLAHSYFPSFNVKPMPVLLPPPRRMVKRDYDYYDIEYAQIFFPEYGHLVQEVHDSILIDITDNNPPNNFKNIKFKITHPDWLFSSIIPEDIFEPMDINGDGVPESFMAFRAGMIPSSQSGGVSEILFNNMEDRTWGFVYPWHNNHPFWPHSIQIAVTEFHYKLLALRFE